MTDLLYKFTSKEWKFDNNNTRELWSSLSHDDRMTFWFSFEGFDWILFIKTYSSGVRKFILGEDQRNIEEALAKNRRYDSYNLYVFRLTYYVLYKFQIVLDSLFVCCFNYSFCASSILDFYKLRKVTRLIS